MIEKSFWKTGETSSIIREKQSPAVCIDSPSNSNQDEWESTLTEWKKDHFCLFNWLSAQQTALNVLSGFSYSALEAVCLSVPPAELWDGCWTFGGDISSLNVSFVFCWVWAETHFFSFCHEGEAPAAQWHLCLWSIYAMCFISWALCWVFHVNQLVLLLL